MHQNYEPPFCLIYPHTVMFIPLKRNNFQILLYVISFEHNIDTPGHKQNKQSLGSS